jgi:hypothetical protein
LVNIDVPKKPRKTVNRTYWDTLLFPNVPKKAPNEYPVLNRRITTYPTAVSQSSPLVLKHVIKIMSTTMTTPEIIAHLNTLRSRIACGIMVISVVGLYCFVTSAKTDERLWLDAKINGKRVHLCFDSGSDAAVLFREAAERFGLKVQDPATNASLPAGQIAAGTTEPFLLNVEGVEGKARFRVIDTPNYVNFDFDGIVGWRNVRSPVVKIDALAGKVTFLQKVPARVSEWNQFAVLTNLGFLALEVPAR